MQPEGTIRIFRCHQGSARGVAFSPKYRFLFCSGADEGKVNFYNAVRNEIIYCCRMPSPSEDQCVGVNAIRFTPDGSMILASTTDRKLVVIDATRGQRLSSYENTTFGGSIRTGLATDPSEPNLAISVAPSGTGLSILDLRTPSPFDSIQELHDDVIRDICFLPETWPWPNSILTGAIDGSCRVSSIDGRLLHSFQPGHPVNSVCVTPEPYSWFDGNDYPSLVMSGGNIVSAYAPEFDIQHYINDHGNNAVWKLRYTSDGNTLYTVCAGGVLRRYQRHRHHHEFLGEVFSHKDGIQDLDISPNDEYLITASKDQTVGIVNLAAPDGEPLL